MKKLIVLALVAAPLFAFAHEQNDLVQMPKMPPQQPAYQCLKDVDCMPIVADEMVKYCQDTQAYAAWARLNCGFDPSFSF